MEHYLKEEPTLQSFHGTQDFVKYMVWEWRTERFFNYYEYTVEQAVALAIGCFEENAYDWWSEYEADSAYFGYPSIRT